MVVPCCILLGTTESLRRNLSGCVRKHCSCASEDLLECISHGRGHAPLVLVLVDFTVSTMMLLRGVMVIPLVISMGFEPG